MSKIKEARLAFMTASSAQYPQDGLREIAFVGRSNVGKSSLLNALLGRKKLAYTSSKPGKTRTINFYLVNEAFYFVDLPGYGYAQTAKSTRADWEKQMTGYLKHREELALVVQLVDSRHEPTALDLEMSALLHKSGLDFVVAATKRDKISSNVWQKNARAFREKLGLPSNRIFPVSTMDKDSIFLLRDKIFEHAAPEGEDA